MDCRAQLGLGTYQGGRPIADRSTRLGQVDARPLSLPTRTWLSLQRVDGGGLRKSPSVGASEFERILKQVRNGGGQQFPVAVDH